VTAAGTNRAQWRSWAPLGSVVAVLLSTNVADAVLPGRGWPLLTHVVAIVALLWLAGRDGLTRHDLGIAPGDLRRGVAWSVLIVVAVGIFYLAVGLIPATRDFLADDKAALTGTDLIIEIVLRIPLVTVLFEEVAFRGVLLAQGIARLGRTGGVLLSSALFGLWHLLPSLGLADRNDALGSAAGDIGAIALTVGFTAGAGVIFCWLRLRTGSLLTPIALHWSVNAFGLAAAWWVLQG
jgi:membrane protease YdiL (CAAX protease family)